MPTLLLQGHPAPPRGALISPGRFRLRGWAPALHLRILNPIYLLSAPDLAAPPPSPGLHLQITPPLSFPQVSWTSTINL